MAGHWYTDSEGKKVWRNDSPDKQNTYRELSDREKAAIGEGPAPESLGQMAERLKKEREAKAAMFAADVDKKAKKKKKPAAPAAKEN